MNKMNLKLLSLKARRAHIIQRGRYKKMPGVLKKVERQIKSLEKCNG